MFRLYIKMHHDEETKYAPNVSSYLEKGGREEERERQIGSRGENKKGVRWEERERTREKDRETE